MNWSDLCQGNVVTGKAIDLNTLYGANVNHNRRGKTGLPAANLLRLMAAAAANLDLPAGLGKGIKFHVAHCTVGSTGLNVTPKLSKFANHKPGPAVCYEDTVLPVDMPPGHVLVHQSVAPCKRCRGGYRAWARSRLCTVVVSADAGYDQSGNNKVFVFCPTGLVFFG